MSRHLSRIRNLISEIDEIQRHGQAKARVPLYPAPIADVEPVAVPEPVATAPAPIPEPVAQAVPPPRAPIAKPAPVQSIAPKPLVVAESEPDESSPTVTGRIALSMSNNVVVELRLENDSETVGEFSGEIVQIKKLPDGIEILFQDGKAFHIPFKAVA